MLANFVSFRFSDKKVVVCKNPYFIKDEKVKRTVFRFIRINCYNKNKKNKESRLYKVQSNKGII